MTPSSLLVARRTGAITEIGRPLASERAYADELVARGFDVVLLGRNHMGADLLINGDRWELKTLRRGTTNAVRQGLRRAKRQCPRVVIDGRPAGLRAAMAVRAARRSAHAGRLDGLEQITLECVDGSPRLWITSFEEVPCRDPLAIILRSQPSHNVEGRRPRA